MHWLNQQRATINPQFIHAKLADYHISDYVACLSTQIKQIDDIIHRTTFHQEMTRFLPTQILQHTLDREEFRTVLTRDIRELLAEVENTAGKP